MKCNGEGGNQVKVPRKQIQIPSISDSDRGNGRGLEMALGASVASTDAEVVLQC